MKRSVEPKNDLKISQHQQEKCQQFQQNSPKEQALLFIGDSIIEFFPLKKFLGQNLNLVNHGIAGISANWLSEHVQEVLGQQNPNKIFLLIGTNDIGMGYALDEIIGHIEKIINELRIHAYGSSISLISILPVNESPDYQAKVKIRRNNTIRALNHRLENLVGIEFINVYGALLDNLGQLAEPYTQEGLHLTQEGYEQLARALKLYL
ncbi:GDSL-type esterase/lipase family protein [Streptococcus dentapri]|uniref:GDSL-type esterase/lipase family protein n=1 Tax=Streptococcus dentapri TaxID=573564 RepID=A0ABV8D2I9_9STRE